MERKDPIFGFNEGIDTITIECLYIDYEQVSKYIIANGKKIKKYITIQTYKSYNFRLNDEMSIFHLRIQAEALDMNKNIYNQISDIVYNLYELGICKPPFIKVCQTEQEIRTKMNLLLPYLIRLNRVDFHFDFKEGCVQFIKPNMYINKDGNISYTGYSSDGKKINQSHWCVYDRRPKELATNHFNPKTVENMLFPIRIEYRLKSKNTPYLSLYNLYGTFHEIICRYAEVIARSWRDRGCKVANVVTPDKENNPYFYAIMWMALAGKQLINKKSLKKKQRIPNDNLDKYVRQEKEIVKEPEISYIKKN